MLDPRTYLWLSGAFMTGLSTGAVCASVCGAVLLPLVLGGRGSLGANVRTLVVFSLGRLAAYL
ncbi:hypothetical protein GX586_14970 [bacterium]|nr:hypothetical protein [bacterium]